MQLTYSYRRENMKKGLIITTALAMALGVGVAVGAQQQKVEKAEATTEKLYFDVSSTTWWNDASAKTFAYCFKGEDTQESDRNASWPGVEMTKEAGTTYKYSVSVSSEFTKVIFCRVNPSDESEVWNRTSKHGGTPVNLPADYSVKNQFNLTADGSNYDDGNYCGNWTLYTPTNYDVTVVLDNKGNKTTTHQTVAKDGVPTVEYVYGEKFSGWFDDENYTEGHEVTAITANTTVYGKIETIPTHTYTLDASLVSEVFTAPQLWAWVSGKNNAENFPGVAISNNSFTLPEGAEFIISSKAAEQGRKQTVNLSQPGSPVANETLIINSEPINDNENPNNGKYTAYWQLDEEAPADGYYLVGTENNFKFRGATVIPEIPADASSNVAILLNYTAKVNEKVTVRKSIKNVPGWIASADPEHEAEGEKAYGYRDENNFKFTTAGSYDIFVHTDGFYVAPHAERLTISVVDRFFEGKS